MKRLVILLFISIALGLFPADRAAACSCIPPATPQEEMADATAVFAGRVLDMKEPVLNTSSLDPVSVRLQVSRSWKGPLTNVIEVETAISSASCGFPFERDREYVVYANGHADDLQVSLCSRTALAENATEDLTAFGRGITPQDIQNSQEESGRTDDLRIARYAVGILIGLGVGTWLLFRLAPKLS